MAFEKPRIYKINDIDMCNWLTIPELAQICLSQPGEISEAMREMGWRYKRPNWSKYYPTPVACANQFVIHVDHDKDTYLERWNAKTFLQKVYGQEHVIISLDNNHFLCEYDFNYGEYRDVPEFKPEIKSALLIDHLKPNRDYVVLKCEVVMVPRPPPHQAGVSKFMATATRKVAFRNPNDGILVKLAT